MTENVPLPNSLIKLEELRVLNLAHYGRRHALRERMNELLGHKRRIQAEIAEASAAFSGRAATVEQGDGTLGRYGNADAYRQKTVARLQRHLLAVEQVIPVVQSALTAADRTAGDAAAYQAAARHLQKTMADWGLSE